MLEWKRLTWQKGELPPYDVNYLAPFGAGHQAGEFYKFVLFDGTKFPTYPPEIDITYGEKSRGKTLKECKRLAEIAMRYKSPLYDIAELVKECA